MLSSSPLHVLITIFAYLCLSSIFVYCSPRLAFLVFSANPVCSRLTIANSTLPWSQPVATRSTASPKSLSRTILSQREPSIIVEILHDEIRWTAQGEIVRRAGGRWRTNTKDFLVRRFLLTFTFLILPVCQHLRTSIVLEYFDCYINPVKLLLIVQLGARLCTIHRPLFRHR